MFNGAYDYFRMLADFLINLVSCACVLIYCCLYCNVRFVCAAAFDLATPFAVAGKKENTHTKTDLVFLFADFAIPCARITVS